MATSQNLVVNLTARTQAFEAGMRRGKKSVGGLSKNVAVARRAMGRMFKVISVASIAAAMGVGYMIKEQMKQIDVTSKLARRIGMATEELVGLQYASQLGGMTTEGFNKSIETFTRRLGEVRMGTGQARLALEAMGVSTNTLIKMKPAAAFRLIADRMNGLRTQADKAAASTFLFGRQGGKMLNVMEGGSKGLLKMRDEAIKFGLAFSAKKGLGVEMVNDALTKLKTRLSATAVQMTTELAPALLGILNYMESVSVGSGGMAKTVTASMRATGNSVLAVADVFHVFAESVRLAHISTRRFGALIKLPGPSGGLTYKPLSPEERTGLTKQYRAFGERGKPSVSFNRLIDAAEASITKAQTGMAKRQQQRPSGDAQILKSIDTTLKRIKEDGGLN